MLTQVTNEGLTYCILICIRFCFCFTVKPQLFNQSGTNGSFRQLNSSYTWSRGLGLLTIYVLHVQYDFPGILIPFQALYLYSNKIEFYLLDSFSILFMSEDKGLNYQRTQHSITPPPRYVILALDNTKSILYTVQYYIFYEIKEFFFLDIKKKNQTKY